MKKLFLSTLFFLVVAILSVPTFAAQALHLYGGRTYKNLDFNGDGVLDTFSYTYDRYDDGNITIVFNGVSQKVFVARGTAIYYYKYSDSQIYLFIHAHQYGGRSLMVYRFNGNKIQQVNDNLGVMATTTFEYVKGKYVYASGHPYHQLHIASFKELNIDNYTDVTTFLFKYKLKNGKFQLASRYADTERAYSMTYRGKAFTTSSSATKINKKGVKLNPGAKVQLVGVYVIPTKVTYSGHTYNVYKYRFKIKYNGKYGWFVNGTNRPFS